MLARGRTSIRIAGRDLAEVRYAQARVRSAIEAIVHGDHYQVDIVGDVGGVGCVTAQLRPSRQTPVREWSQVPRRRYVVAVRFDAPLSTCVLITALELLAAVPPQLLRWCPWPVKRHTITPPDLPLRRGALRQLNSPGAPRSKPRVSTECGRAFAGKKRQKWCPLHQEAAARERDRRAQQAHRARRRAAQERKAKTEQRRKVR